MNYRVWVLWLFYRNSQRGHEQTEELQPLKATHANGYCWGLLVKLQGWVARTYVTM